MAEEVKRGVEMVSGSVRYVHPPLQDVCTDGVWHRTFELAVAVLVVPFSQHVTLQHGAVSVGEAFGRRRQAPNLLLAWRACRNAARRRATAHAAG